MKKISVLFAVTIAVVGVCTASCDSIKSAKLQSDVDTASYAIGIANGNAFREQLSTVPGEPLNLDDLIAGFAVALKGDTAAQKMTPEASRAFIETYFVKAQAKASEAAKAEGQKFLDENKSKSGVITTESGLQYQIITEGTGEKPAATDQVKVHYTGTLFDGTEFDSSIGKEPLVIGVNQVIPGWSEGLQIMPVGSKYIFWIPSELAYGERSPMPLIKPNSALKFEVELLEIIKGE
jgi:FKBP-type peptidyl-prolyl cis-trans isomerase FkpA/FKBP-type peptidyl-prolyl cis-trans isomerase FklB